MNDEQPDAVFEQQVVAMLHRRAADISTQADETLPMVDVIELSPSTTSRRIVPWGIAAAVVLFAGVLGVVAWPDQTTDEQVTVVDQTPTNAASRTRESETPVPAPDPQIAAAVESDTTAAWPSTDDGLPAEFFDRNGNSLGFAYLSEVDGTIVVLDPPGTDLVDLTLRQFDFSSPFTSGSADLIDVLATGDLKIQTTIDPVTQAMAQQAIDDIVPADDRHFSMTIVAVDPVTGEVLTAAGWFGSPTATVERPTGSLYQMFLLGAAISSYGVEPDDLFSGVGPCEALAEDGTVRVLENFAASAGAVDSIRNQLLRSSRCAFADLLELGGDTSTFAPREVMALPISGRSRARVAPVSPFEDLTIGPRYSPVEVAHVASVFAAGGLQPAMQIVTAITDSEGELRWSAPAQDPVRVMSQDAACTTSAVLQANVATGTGTRAQLDAQPAAGKTGTLDTFTDAWFVGYTPYLVTSVWMGNANPTESVPMTNVGGRTSVTGGSYPAEAFGHFNQAFHQDRPVVPFAACSGAVTTPSNPDAGQPVAPPGPPGSLCPPGFSQAVDTDDDGVPDVCHKDE